MGMESGLRVTARLPFLPKPQKAPASPMPSFPPGSAAGPGMCLKDEARRVGIPAGSWPDGFQLGHTGEGGGTEDLPAAGVEFFPDSTTPTERAPAKR